MVLGVKIYDNDYITCAYVPKVETGYAGQRGYGSDGRVDDGEHRRGHGHRETGQHADDCHHPQAIHHHLRVRLQHFDHCGQTQNC